MANPSIRKILVFNLLLSITITTSLTAIGNYFLGQKEIQRHLDNLLEQATLSFEALVGEHHSVAAYKRIQAELDALPNRAREYYGQISHYASKEYRDKFQFQIWDRNNRLLVHSANSPKAPLSTGETGFSERYINGVPWRVFTTVNKNSGISIVVAERHDIRDELGRSITRDAIYIMLLTYPLLGLLIWVIIGHGLSAIKRVADEVSDREESHLEPVDLESVPLEVKPLVDELNRLFLRLQQAFEREKRFAADAAHELRTPLAALKTQAQLALKATEPEVLKESLKDLIKGVNRSTRVVEQLLTLSRIMPETNRLEDIKILDLNRLVAEELAALAPLAFNKQIDIELVEPDVPMKIKGNALVLSILIKNLVDNAIRYTPQGGDIRVAIRSIGRQIILSVIDSGPGIPLEYRTRVFERFFRVLGTKTTGTGLGLAIVQKIATLHDASVHLSTPSNGKGLEVEVCFPKP